MKFHIELINLIFPWNIFPFYFRTYKLLSLISPNLTIILKPFKKSTHNILVVWKNPIAAPFTITKEIQSGWSFEYLKNLVRCFYFRLFCCTSNIGMVKNHFTWNIWHNWRWWFIQPCNVQITQQYFLHFLSYL